ncbi:MAG: VOC family protein [Bacteroidales bacterium]|nr:VOC family protein [Bacteroidales bacterium]
MSQKITPFLWFDNQAEEAVNLYTSLFKDSKIENISHYGEGSPMSEGAVMSISFQLQGQNFIALNGGPMFSFSPAMSLFVNCENQDEVDLLWEKLGKNGSEMQCGWLTDRFGVTWQIVPTILPELLNDDDEEKAARAMQAMLGMKKLDINELKQAFDGN